MIELAPGLSYWLAPHPDWEEGENWPREVPSFRFASRDGAVLIDPLLPPGGDALFDDDPPARILITAPWHRRDAAVLADRYGAPVWEPETGGGEAPAGVEVLRPDGAPKEALFFLPEQRALIPGDFFSATGGHFRFFDADESDLQRVRAWLPVLCELPIQSVLVAHGDFVLADGAARVREAVDAARRGDG